MCVNEYDTILDDQNQGFAAPFSVLAPGRGNHQLAPAESNLFVKLASRFGTVRRTLIEILQSWTTRGFAKRPGSWRT
ncbi:hypothetical protein Plim_3970 [Planctopirus limnophila DSM 3776]|uniref:Uncharacterized protein n=1 Tax=Planctopirus limnophila (strain ATCC 43296 / DSM 3776 / IFAM 1008 / Mu 290) TaxID=521674 RepID=D5SXY8_PLAL2|nr:hypothetical protein Plim_3970 [Planctopirus limnophila DSM 3776]